MKEVNNFMVWYDYDILGWPPVVLGDKYSIDPSRICNMVRKKRDIYDKYVIPEKWLCLPRWNKERDGIFWPPKGDNYGV